MRALPISRYDSKISARSFCCIFSGYVVAPMVTVAFSSIVTTFILTVTDESCLRAALPCGTRSEMCSGPAPIATFVPTLPRRSFDWERISFDAPSPLPGARS